MRGEHYYGDMTGLATKGSSPHARGALREPPDGRHPAGIIPACAGSTIAARRARHDVRDHPRMRGEHVMSRIPWRRAQGSSPHARGARDCSRHLAQSTGIIPACAGSTMTARACRASERDHPRMRGEHDEYKKAFTPAKGSSPHARGAQGARRGRQVPTGIIPACAGSTSQCRRRPGWRWDHPRMRGEHTKIPRHYIAN